MEKRIKNIKIVNKLFINSSLFIFVPIFISIFLFLFPLKQAYSKNIIEEISEPKPSRFLPFKINQINPLDKIFYFYADSSSSFSLNRFKYSPLQVDIGIKHSLYNIWLLGFNVGFLNIDYKGKKLYSFKVSQEISYPVNFYHPVYVLPGLKVGYGFPNKNYFNFLELDLDRKNFLFFSGFINILYYYSSNYSFCFRIDLNRALEEPNPYSFLSIGLGIMVGF